MMITAKMVIAVRQDKEFPKKSFQKWQAIDRLQP
jgi:hypothetical protein